LAAFYGCFSPLNRRSFSSHYFHLDPNPFSGKPDNCSPVMQWYLSSSCNQRWLIISATIVQCRNASDQFLLLKISIIILSSVLRSRYQSRLSSCWWISGIVIINYQLANQGVSVAATTFPYQWRWLGDTKSSGKHFNFHSIQPTPDLLRLRSVKEQFSVALWVANLDDAPVRMTLLMNLSKTNPMHSKWNQTNPFPGQKRLTAFIRTNIGLLNQLCHG